MHQHQGLHARRGGCPSGRAARPARGAPRTRLPPRPATKDAPAPATEAAPAKQQPQQPPVYIQDAVTTAFLDWAKAAGVAFDRLRPAAYGGLRGLAAAAPIKTDDLILSVPRAAALTLPPRQRCPCPEYVTAEFWDAAPWFARLGVRLLAERAKGGASRLQRYLQQLPKDLDTPVTWSDERLQQLQYPYLIQKVAQQQQEWAALHASAAASAAPGAAPPSRADFFWALAAVRSRTFSGPYVASTLQDRLRLAGLVAFLGVGNVLLQGPDGIEKSAGAAVAVFVFNILYEVILSQKLRQYAMCPVIDLANHSSSGTVGGGAAERGGAGAWCGGGR
ncbi:hypothetical protein MNEG_4645 [Monoraphidium neglectum]|uniref:Uncharacterized protein n=1 Tax=Monoraphidium neglectum TaxID=145388 RepID=A0A0D2JXF2_9CHLO|nr:hypothetical protein MNEG_4645 [Monoraphidium neglectum]KIZ03308.1 hypothetical protein MNEG_4645 [Monoraphidium neglectum]|eukprot:XP_013902327.1 hypothetical protein MNEG_4645 [Monoraphidium neglectum]